MAIEQPLIGIMTGIDGKWRPDLVMWLDDKAGPIIVEIGSMRPEGKWNSVTSKEDNKPIRVLRVGFDGSVWLFNPRHTPIEEALMKYYRTICWTGKTFDISHGVDNGFAEAYSL